MKTAIFFWLVTWPLYVSAADDEVRQSIIDRCRDQMGEYGASMVKFCVDEDLAAYSALQGYDDRYTPIIDRCTRQILSIGGWSMVRFCADEDIEAERALEDY
ncbi:MAG: hypothetical protein OXI74_08460 [Rhodospirillaceae bacterium]|nr:hypothetical protein [Rhodospirillaceae bacterium]